MATIETLLSSQIASLLASANPILLPTHVTREAGTEASSEALPFQIASLLASANSKLLPARVSTEASTDASTLPSGLSVQALWTEEECRSIERDIDNIKVLANSGQLKSGTVDRTPLRSKYFFGYGYTYGAQIAGKGQEQLLPPDYVDPIPEWIHSKLIMRLEEKQVVPKGWINSAVVNDYSPGGMIVSHIDPKQLFARPICIATFFAEGRLVFGVRFVFDGGRFSSEKSSEPKYVASMPRGTLTLMDGFSADGITHGIRPDDFDSRRVSIVLRHVFTDAPKLEDPSMLLKPAQRGAPAKATRLVGIEASATGVIGKHSLDQTQDQEGPPAKARKLESDSAAAESRNVEPPVSELEETFWENHVDTKQGLLGPAEERMWYYKDVEGCIQGPFTSSVMSSWSMQGFLPVETMVRAEDEADFSELGNGMRLLMAAAPSRSS